MIKVMLFVLSFSLFGNDLLRDISDIDGDDKRKKARELALVFINYSDALKGSSVENYLKYKKQLIKTVYCIESYDFSKEEKLTLIRLMRKTMNKKYLKLESYLAKQLSRDHKKELMLLETSTVKECK